VARALIDAGALVNGRRGDFETPLLTAASYGDAEVARVLIDAGAASPVHLPEPDQGAGIRRRPPAAGRHRPAHRGGKPVNQADAEWERLPLHTAAGNGRAASVRRLLAHGADPNVRDPRHHRTPLEECQRAGSPGHREVQAILRPLTQDDTQR
jgi:ankyrin repeat protein